MTKWIKRVLYNFSTEAKMARYQKKMHDFLSQAEDILHLEALEKEWDKNYRRLYRNW